MLIAILAAVGSVALGASIALFPGLRGGALGVVRTFALIAAITVVAGHLLPEAAEALGPLAIALVAFGVVLPTWVEELVERLAPSSSAGHAHGHAHEHGGGGGGLGLELAYAGLIVHHVGDGVALWQYGASAHASLDVVLALVAHTVPVTAVFVLQFTAMRGRSTAMVRTAGLAAATIAGILLGWIFPEALDAVSPWIAALVSGLLLHVIAHDIEADPPESGVARSVDLAAAAAGVVIPLYASHAVELSRVHQLAELSTAYAPPLLAAVLVVAALGVARPRIAMFASPRESLVIAGARVQPFAIAFAALGGPVLRVEVFVLAVWFLGVQFALFAAAAAIATVCAASFVAGRLARVAPAAAEPDALRYGDRVEALLHHLGPWMIAAALVVPYVDARAAGALSAPAVMIFAFPIYLGSVALVPLAAKGLAAGAAIVLLLVGPMMHLDVIRFLTRALGRAAAIGAVVTIIALTALAGFVAVNIPMAQAAFELPRSASLASTALFGILVLRSVWRMGTRRWIAGLGIDHSPKTPQ